MVEEAAVEETRRQRGWDETQEPSAEAKEAGFGGEDRLGGRASQDEPGASQPIGCWGGRRGEKWVEGRMRDRARGRRGAGG